MSGACTAEQSIDMGPQRQPSLAAKINAETKRAAQELLAAAYGNDPDRLTEEQKLSLAIGAGVSCRVWADRKGGMKIKTEPFCIGVGDDGRFVVYSR